MNKSILILNDLHIPFHRNDILSIIQSYHEYGDLNTIIFGGDIIDCKSISSFPDLDDITIEQEIETAINFFKKVREIVGDSTKIICIKGNHEVRWDRYISKMHDKALYKFINPNILEMLRDGMTLYCNGEMKFIEGDPKLEIVNNWYINYERIIVCHPTNFYTQATKNATTAVQYFIDKEDFDVLICAHNHHQAMCYSKGKWAIESGCCCKPMDYTNGKTTSTDQDYGFVYLVVKNGKVMINDSIIYRLK